MANKQPINDRNPQPGTTSATGTFKIAALTTALLVAEAAAIVGLFAFVGRPSATMADAPVIADEEVVEEIPLFQGRLSNDRAGTVLVFDTEIYVQVRKSEAERIRNEIERTRHELRAEISGIWRSAEPANFQESRFETLTARLEATLRDRFNRAGRQGVSKVVVVSGAGIRLGR